MSEAIPELQFDTEKGLFFPTDAKYELGSLMPENDHHWHCELYGCGPQGMCWYPPKGMVPNWFWRKMQWLILGNKWVYKP